MNKVQITFLQEHCRNLSVLYVEDDTALAYSTTLYLKKLFGTVVTCFDGHEAFEVYKNMSFDLVITDLAMPKLDGFGLIALIKEQNPDQIIMINSAFNDNSYQIEADKFGVDGYLNKPTNNDQFIETLYKMTKKIIERGMMEQ